MTVHFAHVLSVSDNICQQAYYNALCWKSLICILSHRPEPSTSLVQMWLSHQKRGQWWYLQNNGGIANLQHIVRQWWNSSSALRSAPAAKTRNDQIFNWCSHASGDKLLLRRICKSVGRPVSQELPDHRYSQTTLELPSLGEHLETQSSIFVHLSLPIRSINLGQIGWNLKSQYLPLLTVFFPNFENISFKRALYKKMQPKQHINGKEADLNS